MKTKTSVVIFGHFKTRNSQLMNRSIHSLIGCFDKPIYQKKIDSSL